MCQMIIKHYICPVLRPRKGISELESAGDSNDCKTGGSVRLYPRIPFALAMGVCQALNSSFNIPHLFLILREIAGIEPTCCTMNPIKQMLRSSQTGAFCLKHKKIDEKNSYLRHSIQNSYQYYFYGEHNRKCLKYLFHITTSFFFMFIILLYKTSPVVISCALTLIRTQSFNQLGLCLSNSLALVLNIISLASDTGIDLLLISLLLFEPVEDNQSIQI